MNSYLWFIRKEKISRKKNVTNKRKRKTATKSAPAHRVPRNQHTKCLHYKRIIRQYRWTMWSINGKRPFREAIPSTNSITPHFMHFNWRVSIYTCIRHFFHITFSMINIVPISLSISFASKYNKTCVFVMWWGGFICRDMLSVTQTLLVFSSRKFAPNEQQKQNANQKSPKANYALCW